MNLSLNLIKVFERYKNKTAIIIGKKKYSYNFLKIKSDQIISQFKQENINTKDVVLIFNNKNIEEFLMMIACLRSGVIYSNIDPSLPGDRIRLMVKNLNPKIFYSKKYTKNILNNINKKKIFRIRKTNKVSSKASNKFSKFNPLYIIYTSGSSGIPKGVCVNHNNVINFIKWSKKKFKIQSKDNITNLNPMYFDNSVFDFYNSIFNGATMVVFKEDDVKKPENIMKIIKTNNCTIWYSVPSLLIYCQNLRAFEIKNFFKIKKIVFAGEPFPKYKLYDLFKKFRENIIFFNAYGPTETTCLCSAHKINLKDFKSNYNLVTLGKLNDGNCLFKINVTKKNYIYKNFKKGELHIGGSFVSDGYYKNKKLTSEKFYELKSKNKKVRFYNSGDLVIKDKKGFYHYKGRSDNQIKIMGYRIELEDIEMNINKLKYVNQSCVLLDKNKQSTSLVAFISSKNKNLFTFKQDLKKHLPHYMMPKKFVFMKSLPFNRNGKLDKNRLKKQVNLK